MPVKKKRDSAKKLNSKVALTDTLIENALTARKSSHIMGGEFVGATALSYIAGFADTAGFLTLFGLFTAHITGNLITAAAVMVKGIDAASIIRLLMLPVFMLTIIFTTLLLRFMQRRGAASLAPMLAIMTFALALFAAAGVYFGKSATNAGSPSVAIIGAIGIAAMGIQNAMMRGALKSFAPTTVMTGNLAQLTIDLVDIMFPSTASTKAEREKVGIKRGQRLRKSGLPLLGFILGCFSGAWITNRYGLLSISVPTGVAAILTIVTWWRSRRIF